MYTTFTDETLFASAEPTPVYLALPGDVIEAIKKVPEFTRGKMGLHHRLRHDHFHDLARLAPHHWDQILHAAMRDKAEGRRTASDRTVQIISTIVSALGLAVAVIGVLVAIVAVAIAFLAASLVVAAIVAIIGLIVAILALGLAIVSFIVNLIIGAGEQKLWSDEEAGRWLDGEFEKLGLESVVDVSGGKD